jgi:hypothetical protein
MVVDFRTIEFEERRCGSGPKASPPQGALTSARTNHGLRVRSDAGWDLWMSHACACDTSGGHSGSSYAMWNL